MVKRAFLIQPGSKEPTDPEQVEALLRWLPALAFEPELQACVPSRCRRAPLTPARLDAEADADFLEQVAGSLRALQSRAAAEDNGGLSFLVRTCLYFVETRLPPSEHPLLVALFFRAEARGGKLEDSPAAIATMLDRWPPS